MYLPAHFEEPRADQWHAVAEAAPLATLAWRDGSHLQAEHVPLLWDNGPADGPHGTLRGHVARANPLWQRAAGQELLVIFQGPQAYVSPSWYPTKAEHGKVVPTWNYVVVHATGPLRAVDDSDWLHALVSRLTQRHEAGRAAPWKVDDAPAEYLAQMRRAIVGIEVPVHQVQAKFKLSQNHAPANRQGVVGGLGGEPGEAARAVGTWMSRASGS